MNKIIIIADKVMPDSKLIGLINDHFPDQEIVILRRGEAGGTGGSPGNILSGMSMGDFIKEVKW